MTRSVEIPEEAARKAARVFAEQKSQAWLTFSDETRDRIAASWEPTARLALAAALPYLAPAVPQPVDREARAFAQAIRSDLEDWSDEECRKFLRQFASAVLAGEQEQVESPE